MYKLLIVLVAYLAFTEARPKWQFLPEMPGYVPVYIQNGDTPLEEINPDLAEAFHALPAGRSVGKEVDAVPEIAPKDSILPELEHSDIPEPSDNVPEPSDNVPEPSDKVPELSDSVIDRRPYEKKIASKGSYEVKSQERR